MRIGLVTTAKNADKVLDTFIKYHLSSGFYHIFIFLDNPNDLSFSTYKNYESITLIKNDSELHDLWEETESYLYHHQFIQREVMSRQILNVAVTISLCLQKKIDWLLHIDIDELFYSPDATVSEHFEKMSQMNHGYIRYLNHEAIPEKMEINDYFLEVSLFKKNLMSLEKAKQDIILNRIVDARSYFLFYANGKSAVRIEQGVIPTSVRDFDCNYKMHTSTNAFILHYPCCGFYHFWTKYRTLEYFSDRWFGKQEIAKNVPIHIKSRDIVQIGNEQSAREFYQKFFLDQHKDNLQFLSEENVLFRKKINL